MGHARRLRLDRREISENVGKCGVGACALPHAQHRHGRHGFSLVLEHRVRPDSLRCQGRHRPQLPDIRRRLGRPRPGAQTGLMCTTGAARGRALRGSPHRLPSLPRVDTAAHERPCQAVPGGLARRGTAQWWAVAHLRDASSPPPRPVASRLRGALLGAVRGRFLAMRLPNQVRHRPSEGSPAVETGLGALSARQRLCRRGGPVLGGCRRVHDHDP